VVFAEISTGYAGGSTINETTILDACFHRNHST
jgi:hypothetical protein